MAKKKGRKKVAKEELLTTKIDVRDQERIRTIVAERDAIVKAHDDRMLFLLTSYVKDGMEMVNYNVNTGKISVKKGG